VIDPASAARRSTGKTIRTVVSDEVYHELELLAAEDCTTLSGIVRRLVVQRLRQRRTARPDVA
jgi:hypothetical protein